MKGLTSKNSKSHFRSAGILETITVGPCTFSVCRSVNWSVNCRPLFPGRRSGLGPALFRNKFNYREGPEPTHTALYVFVVHRPLSIIAFFSEAPSAMSLWLMVDGETRVSCGGPLRYFFFQFPPMRSSVWRVCVCMYVSHFQNERCSGLWDLCFDVAQCTCCTVRFQDRGVSFIYKK